MDKHHLTSAEGSSDAGFNKMPKEQAKIKPLKIKDLHAHRF
ncbi:hypothetical protein QPK32_02270 [Massilia sp. YIM B02763]|nr:hypothetical protein [Massilia sp. YIM B02763]MDN4051912.1 hypothetical protein [Massilia sp. YIM B02763]